MHRYPIIGSARFMTLPGDTSGRPNLVYSVRKFAKQYGSIFSFFLGNGQFVVVTEFEDIKEIFKKEEISARSGNPPSYKLRPGWYTNLKTDPELNHRRPPGVIGSNVNLGHVFKTKY